MKIVFMGTPEFAIPSLQKILESKHHAFGIAIFDAAHFLKNSFSRNLKLKIKADHIKFFVLIICLLFIGIDLLKTISTRMNYCELFFMVLLSIYYPII